MNRNATGPWHPAAAPAPLRPIPEAVPAALRAIARWICWRAGPRDGGKLDKVPHSPHTGRRCDALDPANWGSFDQALVALGRHRLDGLGIVLTGEDALVGVDLDHCLDAAGAIAPWAREIVVAVDSYTETSPSGRGLRLLALGHLPPGRRATTGLEMYDRARFLTITGHHLAGTPATIERRDDALREIHARHLGEETAPAPVPAERAATTSEPPPLDELRATLRCIPQRLTYDEWLHVLMAVHEAYPGPEGVQLCEEWSPGYDGEIAKKFASFKRRGVGVGTLIHLAKQHGWRPPERPASASITSSCGAQDAFHSRPDLAGLPEDVRAYIQQIEAERDAALRRAEQLEGQVTTLLVERNDERDHYRGHLQVLHNETVKPAVRLAVAGLADVLEEAERKGKTEPDGWTPLYLAAVADQAALNERRVGALVEEAAALGLIEKATELHRKTVQRADGTTKSVLCSTLRVRPVGGSVATMLRQAAAVVAPEHGHGGERPKAAPKAAPARCPDHPDAPHIITCTVCGTIIDEREPAGAAATPAPMGCGAQDASHNHDGDQGEAETHSMGPLVEDPSVKRAQAASHSPAPALISGWMGARARRRPEDGAPPRWQEVEVCLDCGAPLPPGRKYRCPACAPAVAAPAPPESGP